MQQLEENKIYYIKKNQMIIRLTELFGRMNTEFTYHIISGFEAGRHKHFEYKDIKEPSDYKEESIKLLLSGLITDDRLK